MWCVGSDGWTVFSPTVGSTGTCTGSASTFNGTCVYYISETGTAATAAACSVAVTGAFDFTTVPANSAACPYQSTFMNAVRNNSSDFILFKRGDCFADPGLFSPCTSANAPSTNSYGICSSSGTTCQFSKNGASANAPVLIGAYGPLTSARPKFITQNNTVAAQATFGNNLAIVSLDTTLSFGVRDYTNATYNPGIITAASSSGVGATTIILSSVPAIINSTNAANSAWQVADLDNQGHWVGIGGNRPGIQVNSISGAVLTLQTSITASQTVTAGDRMVLFPNNVGNGGLSFDPIGNQALTLFYVEDCVGQGIGYQVTGTYTWPNGPQWAIYIRRNEFYQSGTYDLRLQGIFLGDSFNPNSTALIEENVIDHAGWSQVDNDCTVGQFLPSKCNGVASSTLYNFFGNPSNQAHDAYNHENCCSATYQRNILTNAQGTGTQLRSGGYGYNNLIYRNQTGSFSGSIDHAGIVTYNVFGDLTYGYAAVATVTGVSGNTLTFTYLPQVVCSSSSGCAAPSQPFDATNPTGISQTLNTTFTMTNNTMTINGPAVTVSIGDVIYFVQNGSAAWGFDVQSASTSNNGTSINNAYPTDLEYNVFTNSMLGTYRGGPSVSGDSIIGEIYATRATGSKIANNYIMNQANVGIRDDTQIQSVDGTGCGGEVRIGLVSASTTGWNVGDTIVTSGIQPSSMNANGSFTVGSISTPFLCLSGSTFGTGVWTSGTGVINGGVTYSNNFAYNVGTPSTTTQSTPTAFTPVNTAGCPQALGCPSIEGYDLSIGGDGTLSHFLDGAKANRKGSWNNAYTAAAANNYIRKYTSSSMPNPGF